MAGDFADSPPPPPPRDWLWGAAVDAVENEHQTCGSKYTALMLAALHGHADCVAVLLQAGAAVNVMGEGETALMLATERGHADIVPALLQAGAAVDGKQVAIVKGIWGDEEREDYVDHLFDRHATTNVTFQMRRAWSSDVRRDDDADADAAAAAAAAEAADVEKAARGGLGRGGGVF